MRNKQLFTALLFLILIGCGDYEPKNPYSSSFDLQEPDQVSAHVINDHRVEINWDYNRSDAENYQIYRSTADSSFSLIGFADSCIFIDSCIVKNIEYRYVIAASYGDHISPCSDTIRVCTEFPGVSDFSCILLSDVEIGLQWSYPADYFQTFDVDSLILARKSGQDEDFKLVRAFDPVRMSWVDTSLVYGEKYWYQIFAQNEINHSDIIQSDSVVNRISSPGNPAFQVLSDHELLLSWEDRSSLERSYRIERCSGDTANVVWSLDANSTQFTDSTVMIGVQYSYDICPMGLKNRGESVLLNDISLPPFGAPENVTAENSYDNSIRITWEDSCPYASAYRIERSVDGSGFTLVKELSAENTEYSDTALTNGRSYSYRMCSVKSDGISDYSDKTLPVDMTLAPAQNLQVTQLNDNSLKLTWKDAAQWEEYYRVEYQPQGENWSILTQLPENSESYIVDSLRTDMFYRFRVIAGSSYGDSQSSNDIEFWFELRAVDIDGNYYPVITIGTQVWMASNLRVRHYRNGDAIEFVTLADQWVSDDKLVTGGYCRYDNTGTDSDSLGYLYNFAAVQDGRGLAPEGWHIPSDTEWQVLIAFLGGQSQAGAALKSLDGWYNNSNGNGQSGFSAYPAGQRNGSTGSFDQIGKYAYFWSCTEGFTSSVWAYQIYYLMDNIYRNGVDKKNGYSVLFSTVYQGLIQRLAGRHSVAGNGSRIIFQ